MRTHTLTCADVCVCVGECVCWWIQQPHPAHRSALMNTLIMLKSASCLGFPVPSGKVNSGWLHSTARTCGHTGAEGLWRSVLTVLDVSGPKIDLGKQSKYHGNIKVPWWMPENKQTLQAKLSRCSRKVPNQMFSLTDLISSDYYGKCCTQAAWVLSLFQWKMVRWFRRGAKILKHWFSFFTQAKVSSIRSLNSIKVTNETHAQLI